MHNETDFLPFPHTEKVEIVPIMNILFINSIGKSKFGGGERWMLHAAAGLMQRGHNVFVAGKRGGKFLREAAQRKLPVATLSIYTDFSPIATARVAAFLVRHSIEIVVCNLNKDVRVAGLAARLVRTPVVIARHGVLLCGKKWKHKITLQKLADGILTNTQSIKHIYDSYGWFPKDFVKVIYNGVEDFHSVQPYDFRSQFPGKLIIFSAGRLAEQKGFPFLLKAAAQLRQKRKDFVVLIAGEGRLRQSLQRQILQLGLEECVFLLGYQPDIVPFLRGSDIVVLPSLYEGMPNILLEAMSAQKPVVATAVNGVPELVLDGQTGMLVPPADADALSAALDQLLSSQQLRERFARAGYERVQKSFTIDRMLDELEQYFYAKRAEKNSVLNAKQR